MNNFVILEIIDDYEGAKEQFRHTKKKSDVEAARAAVWNWQKKADELGYNLSYYDDPVELKHVLSYLKEHNYKSIARVVQNGANRASVLKKEKRFRLAKREGGLVKLKKYLFG